MSRYKKILRIAMLILILSFCFSEAFSDNSFQFQRIGNIHPYGDNLFRVYSTESGMLNICIHDSICEYRTLSQRILPGETYIHWDGCSYNKEKLYEKSYVITAILITDSGAERSVSFNSPIDYPNQFLLYALPSSDQLFLDSPKGWFLEYRTIKNGTVRIELSDKSNSDPVFSYSIPSNGGKIMRKDFSLICGKKLPATGDYSVSVYEISRPDEKFIFPLHIAEKTPEPQTVTETGEIMPDRSMSEKEIWEMMMRPSVVVDIDFFKHQNVYSEPDSGSRSLGTIHGQTQGIKVIRIESEWALIGAWNHEDASYIEGWVPMSRLKVEKPQNEYGLLIDKRQQTLSLFRKGEKVGTLLVSTGKAEKNRLYQETSAGCFLTGYHRVNFSTNGKKYDYVIQYDGGNLLHQIPYDWGQNKKDFTNGRGYLGAKASHACIRIQAEPDENGLNAYWLFTHLPYHTRVIILDDPQEREATKEQLSRPENSKFDPSILHITDHYGTESENQVQLTFGGNVIPGGSNGFNNRNESMSSFAEKSGYDLPLKKISVLFRNDDLTCVNLCGFFQRSTAAEPSNKGIPYASAGMEAIFGNSSIELVSISQESLYSDGTEHIRNTAVALESYTKAIEQDQTYVKELKGHLIGFACCNESGYLSDPSVIDRLVSSLKDEQCEKIVFLISWKDNRDKSHRIIQEAMAHRCVRAGADLIIGYGQETIQGADYIEGVPVIYSLGTLLDGSTSSAPKNNMGLVIKAIFSFSNDCDSVSVTAVPINAYGNSNNGQNNYCPTADIPETDFSKAIQAFWNDTTDLVMNRLSFYYAGQS